VSSIIFIVGALILALTKTYGVLLFGRVVVGLAVGIASMIVPVYVSKLLLH
jgi:SP family myo-inositol transporter-like MFS transporter 13